MKTMTAEVPASTAATKSVEVKGPLGNLGLCLVVADRGFVWVGDADDEDANWLIVRGARAVRRWGTTEGLNQLASAGPLPNTRLDAPADIKVARKAVIAVIPCEATKWSA